MTSRPWKCFIGIFTIIMMQSWLKKINEVNLREAADGMAIDNRVYSGRPY